jgi:serine/threonine protein kinase
MRGENRWVVNSPQVERELKRDSLGRIELLDGPAGRMLRRVACGSRIPGSGWIARGLLRRERRALQRLQGLAGVPALLDSALYETAPSRDGARPASRDVLLREWIAARPLHLASELPEDFFERLADLVEELHARRVCHNDLHKEPNILVAEDGRPALVDFQLASHHPRAGRMFASRAREDLRHVRKHLRRYRIYGGGPQSDRPIARERRSFVAAAWWVCGKPLYHLVTRRLLRWKDGEGGRPRDLPWPRWTPPVGPAPTRAPEPASSGSSTADESPAR